MLKHQARNAALIVAAALSIPTFAEAKVPAGFFKIGKAIFYSNGNTAYCVFPTWQSFVAAAKGRPPRNVRTLPAKPTDMRDDGACGGVRRASTVARPASRPAGRRINKFGINPRLNRNIQTNLNRFPVRRPTARPESRFSVKTPTIHRIPLQKKVLPQTQGATRPQIGRFSFGGRRFPAGLQRLFQRGGKFSMVKRPPIRTSGTAKPNVLYGRGRAGQYATNKTTITRNTKTPTNYRPGARIGFNKNRFSFNKGKLAAMIKAWQQKRAQSSRSFGFRGTTRTTSRPAINRPAVRQAPGGKVVALPPIGLFKVGPAIFFSNGKNAYCVYPDWATFTRLTKRRNTNGIRAVAARPTARFDGNCTR